MKTKPQHWCLVFHSGSSENCPSLALQRGNERQEGKFREPLEPDIPLGDVLFEIAFIPKSLPENGWAGCYVYDFTETTLDRAGFPERYRTVFQLDACGALARLQELMLECQEGKHD